MDEQQHVLVERFNGLHAEDGRTFGVGGRLLTVFPLRGERQGRLDYVTLAAALATESVAIAELDEPQVNALAVTNRGTCPVLITDGDTLVDGQQNRVVNSTVLLPPGQTILPVSCVERGRWHPEAQGFALSESAYPALRRVKSAQVGRSLHSGARHRADQGAIWREVAERQSAAASHSSTEALRDLYADHRDRLAAYTDALRYPADAVGLIVGYGGRIASLESFDASDTLKRCWSRLIRAAALDALAQPPGVAIPLPHAVRMLHRPQKAACRPFATPGLGADLRLAGGGVDGAALLHEGVVVHAALHRVVARA